MTNRQFVTSFLLVFSLIPPVCGQNYQPEVAAASKDAELALQGFVIPEGMAGSLLAAEPDVANPVAFHVTNDGRVYVCETFRQQVGVEDNRSHMNWLDNDLRLETVEERLAMFRKYLGSEVTAYAKEHDRIRLLQDTDGDGRLDRSTVFADGFSDILDGTGAGVLEVDGKVYYTCIPKLWMLQDTNDDGIADQRDALHHGYGVRVAFRGHDMHGLVRGPDGRIYFSIGDRGYNVITKEGTRLKRPDSGAVFRCDPDGSHLEVFAYGLRNPQELAFDNSGNLFTVDNNSDSGDQARLTYIVQDSDTGWRMYYQYLQDRGPWNRERMWYPFQADDTTTAVQPPHIVPPVANISDGPSGLTFYPGLGLNDRYKDHFFLADFRGGSANSGIRSFAVKSNGAGFDVVDSHQYIWSILATDVAFAPDGSLYVSDWVNGWDGEGKGRLYRFEETDQISAVRAAGVPELLNGGVKKADADALIGLLGHADRRVRFAAQFELADREDLQGLQKAVIAAGNPTMSRHAAWGLWQLGLKSQETAMQVVRECRSLVGARGDLRVQGIKILSDLVDRHGLAIFDKDRKTRNSLCDALRHDMILADARAGGFAAAALGHLGRPQDIQWIVTLLSRHGGTDPVVRHQCVMGLAGIGRRYPSSLVPVAEHENVLVRTAAVLAYSRNDNLAALRRMTQDRNPDVALAAVRALIDERSGSGDEEVAAAGERHNGPPALLRRVLEAHYRLGTSENAGAVAGVAADANQPNELRLLAGQMLKTWNTPQQTNTVNGCWRPIPTRETELYDSILPHIAGLLSGPGKIQQVAVEVAALHGVKDVVPTLEKMFTQRDADATLRVSAFQALTTMLDAPDRIVELARRDESEEVRIAALKFMATRNPDAVVPQIQQVLSDGSVSAKQTAIQLLGQIRRPEAESVLVTTFRMLNAGELPQAVTLDLLEAAERSKASRLTSLVAEFRERQKQIGTKAALWNECLEGGDAERGRTVFFGRAAASCRRCHLVNGEGAAVGPDLSAIAKDKDRNYLLEAIVDPNAKIAKGFETTNILDIDGKIHSGIIREETETVVKLVTPKGAVLTIPVDEIEDRAAGLSGMPADITKGLSRQDVRDLVEYLSTLKVAHNPAEHGKADE